MVRIAVTGGIACGKSRMAEYLEACGIPVCDADAVAHRVLEPGGEAYAEVVEAFGPRVLGGDGEIDRVALGEIVFSDPRQMARLNGLVHPAVKAKIGHWLDAQTALLTPRVAVVAPLLFEAGMAEGWDAVVCVGCSPALQQSRLMERGIDAEGCVRRIEAQMGLAQKMAQSDFVIWNETSVAALEQQIDDVLKAIEERVQ
jgi:dephospho-CoA kinase